MLGRLQLEQTRDHLKIVLDPVMDLLEQTFLFPQRSLELLRAGPHRLLSPLGFRNVVGDALDKQRTPMFVAHNPRLAMNPDHRAVAVERAEFRLEGPPGGAAPRKFLMQQVAVVGMDLVVPEHRIAQPLLLRKAQQFLDLRTHVKLVDVLIERGHRGHHRELFNQRTVTGFGFAPLKLQAVALGQVAHHDDESALPSKLEIRAGDLHREPGSVPAPADGIGTHAERGRAAGTYHRQPAGIAGLADQQHPDMLAHRLRGAVAEDLLGAWVERFDNLPLIKDQDSVFGHAHRRRPLFFGRCISADDLGQSGPMSENACAIPAPNSTRARSYSARARPCARSGAKSAAPGHPDPDWRRSFTSESPTAANARPGRFCRHPDTCALRTAGRDRSFAPCAGYQSL